MIFPLWKLNILTIEIMDTRTLGFLHAVVSPDMAATQRKYCPVSAILIGLFHL